MAEPVYQKKTESYGMFYSNKKPEKIRESIILCSVSFYCSVMFFSAAVFAGDDMLAYGIGIGVLALGLFVISAIRVKKIRKAYNEFLLEVEALKGQKSEKLYLQAKAAGITNLDTEANIQWLEMFARSGGNEVSREELIRQYQAGKKLAEQKERMK